MRLALALVALSAAACSVSTTTTAPPTDTPPADDSTPPGNSPPPPANPPPATNPPPGAAGAITFETCTISDAPQVGALFAAAAGGGALYVDNYNYAMRYTVSTSGTCTLTRDMAFGTNGAIDVGATFAADATGALWRPYFGGTIRRVYPGATLDCTTDPKYASSSVRSMVIDDAGTSGYVVFQNPFELAHVTISASACSISPMTLDGKLFSVELGGIDGAGRIYAWGRDDNGVTIVQVITAAGHVTSFSSFGGTMASSAYAGSRCGSAFCLMFDEYANAPPVYLDMLDPSGNALATADLGGAPRGDATHTVDNALAGTAAGALFWVSLTKDDTMQTGPLVVRRASVKP